MKSTLVNKIEMKGFKSFANKTELAFGGDFNCILGPNGSGKSNVLDAICFVLGKAGAKGLRAEKSANLIYNGGKSKQPAKHGEVSIYFNNKDNAFPMINSEELKISRLIKPSGNSVYKINNDTVTRGQILDVLSAAKIDPDGYNIILQGDIVKLVEMSGQERRKIVEEIAGINLYEDKKQKALRELGRVEDKLNEAEIILTERKTYLEELKKERDQAQEFKDLEDTVKRNKFTLLSTQIQDKKTIVKDRDKKINDLEADIVKRKNSIIANRKQIDELKQKIESINHEVEQKGEKDQVEIHKKVEQLKVDSALNQQRLTTIDTELEKLEQRKKDLDNNLKELQSKIDAGSKEKLDINKRVSVREKQINEIKTKILAFKKKHDLQGADKTDARIQEIDEEADVLQEDITKLREEQQQLFREKDRLDIELQSIDGRMIKLAELEKENKTQLVKLKQMKQEFKKATLELSDSLNKDSSLAAQLNNMRDNMFTKKEELSKFRAKNSAALEAISADRALNRILKSNNPGVYGTVSQIGKVEQKYAMALEIAAGSRIKSLVVDNDSTAAKLIKTLKQERLGTATFLPMNKVRGSNSVELKNLSGNGIHGSAVGLVKYDSRYKNIFSYVFGNTLVVEDIDTARKIGVGRMRMVTLTGDLVESSGAMTGGFVNRKHGLGFKNEEAEGKIEKIELEVSQIESLISKLETDRMNNEEGIQKLREFKANLEGDIIKLEKSLHLEDKDLDADKDSKKELGIRLKEADTVFETVQKEVSSKNQALSKLKIEKQQLRDKINQLRNPAFIAELNSLEEKKSELKQEIIELGIELKGTNSEENRIFLPEIESTKKIIKQLEREGKDFSIEQTEISKLTKTQSKELQSMEAKEAKFYAQFKELFNKRTKFNDEVSKMEAKIITEDDRARSSEMKKNGLSLELAANKAELSGLELDLENYEGVSVFKNKPITEIKSEIAKFEQMLQNLGAVNMKALEIYDRVIFEYEKLEEKKTILQTEKEDVMLMINEIDTKKKELFMKTFKILDENFQKIFGSLSTKGTAFLKIDNPKNLFESDMQIMVKLTGKKHMDIRSLSGGEKTMTALAFLFAVQEHEPASFYVLDEVDAALDKRNSEKLAKLIKDYSTRAQYIIISHNDGVISEANNLYGVSMNEHGMSKVTSLKI